MAEFLSEEWVDGFVGAGASPGPTGTVQVVVTGVSDGDGKWYARVVDGVVAESALGARPAPDVTLTVSSADADRGSRPASSTRAWRSCRGG